MEDGQNGSNYGLHGVDRICQGIFYSFFPFRLYLINDDVSNFNIDIQKCSRQIETKQSEQNCVMA